MSERIGNTAGPVELYRGVRRLEPGSYVYNGRSVLKVCEVLSHDKILALDIESGSKQVVGIDDISPHHLRTDPQPDLAAVCDADYEQAVIRYDAIKPLLGRRRSSTSVGNRAKEVGVSRATIYRWLSDYEATRSIISLVPRKRGWKDGKRRIDKLTEALINEVIEKVYLTPQKISVAVLMEYVKAECLRANIQCPSADTVRRRIKAINPKEALRRRGDAKKAEQLYRPRPGRFPGADQILSVVQIDHTPANVCIVDDEFRRSIGRPWITVAIDVFSRSVMGLYVSLDAPSEVSVAMCVRNSILRKNMWLANKDIEANWMQYGVPAKIHVDNAKEFSTPNFRRSAAAYGITVEYRPVKVPNYGGHIERLLGTFSQAMKELPGATFSCVQERGEYNSDATAAMTMAEFEQWLIIYICNVYHQSIHSVLGVPPNVAWQRGILGDEKTKGAGIPVIPLDELSVELDFLPAVERTVQTVGVTVDGVTYYDDCLRNWISAVCEENHTEKRKFIFRRDPRDISRLWFFDPVLKQYFPVPAAEHTFPQVSIWEYRSIKQKLKDQNTPASTDSIVKAMTDLREHVERSKEKTKVARRELQRQKHRAKEAVKIAQPSKVERYGNLKNDLGGIVLLGEIE